MSKAAALSSVPKTPKHNVTEKFACLLYYCVRKELEETPKLTVSKMGAVLGTSSTSIYGYLNGTYGCSPSSYARFVKKFPLLKGTLEYPPGWRSSDGQTRTLLTAQGLQLYQRLAAAGDAILYSAHQKKSAPPPPSAPTRKHVAALDKKPAAPPPAPDHDDAHTPVTTKGFTTLIQTGIELQKLMSEDVYTVRWIHFMSLAERSGVHFAEFIKILNAALPQ